MRGYFFLLTLLQIWLYASGSLGHSSNKLFVRKDISSLSSVEFLNPLKKDKQLMAVIADGSDPNSEKSNSFKISFKRNALGLWGVLQVSSILMNAIKRLLPIAIRPFTQKDFQPHDWFFYWAFCLMMAYSEGYRGFHLKFSPMVVDRAFSIHKNPSIFNSLLAGPYSMGMFGASRSRLIVSWLLTAGIFSLVKIVKYVPYPYRSIIDAGVVVGLSLGTLSIFYHTVRALFGKTDLEKDNKKDE